MNRYMVLAETEDEALQIARRAYRRWWSSFMSLWQKHNTAPTNVNYPPEIDGQIADGRAIATTPAKALDLLRGQLAESGANYLVCRFAFGDLSLSESTALAGAVPAPRHAGAARERAGRGGIAQRHGCCKTLRRSPDRRKSHDPHHAAAS